MAIINTVDFLPEIFRTSPNTKFLNATLDQLISEPNFRKVNGYVGRTFAPTFKTGDSYLVEPDKLRQDYQLEPGVVVSENNKVKFYNSYVDLINKIKHYGGITTDHSRLFENEEYTFNGRVDFDKLVNFSQYYWLPGGPLTVDVHAGAVETNKTFDIIRNNDNTSYQLATTGTAENPDITLARGGTYKFVIDQSGIHSDGAVNPAFWIQTEPGITGVSHNHSNISTRGVHGVTNNGVSNGTITFNVPLLDGQDIYTSMPLAFTVNFASSARFIDIDNQLLSTVVATLGGIDGITTKNSLNGKYIVFVNNDVSDTNWTELGIYALSGYGSGVYDEGYVVTQDNRNDIWQIQIEDTGNGNQLINLEWVQDIPVGNKITVTSGQQYAGIEFYKKADSTLAQIPLLTAHLDTLYYNDGTNQQYSGRIKIVNNLNYTIDVDQDILTKKQYISPNGVVFSNGLKIKFDSSVTPEQYENGTYYVEGVGTLIRLVNANSLVVPELNDSTQSDYITINRVSVDGNAWSRNNRWFHEQVIVAAANYNEVVPTLNNKARAVRPIIEFDPDLQLFNTGRINYAGVDLIDFTIDNALMQIEGPYQEVPLGITAVGNQDETTITVPDTTGIELGMAVEGVGINESAIVTEIDELTNTITLSEPNIYPVNGDVTFKSFVVLLGLTEGTTIVFANDFDPLVKNKVFTVQLINVVVEGVPTPKCHLSPLDRAIQEFDSIVPAIGTIVPLNTYIPDHQDLTYNPLARTISSLVNLGSDTVLSEVLYTNVGLVKGSSFWYNSTAWIQSQLKTGINVSPLFDLLDQTGYSFSNKTQYVNSSFVGSKIFSYKGANGKIDPVLGFPLSYRNFNNIGDIEFTNNVDTDTFTYLKDTIESTSKISTGFIYRIIDRATTEVLNIWDTKAELSKQYQVISNTFDGSSNYFEIDILPDAINHLPNSKVFVNNKLLPPTSYSFEKVGVKDYIYIPALTINDRVDILIYSKLISTLGHYEIPPALEMNTLNSSFSSLTLGQFRNHLTTIVSNSTEVVGQVPGESNLRDLNIKDHGGSILQHSAPTIYSSLFLASPDLNFIDSVTLAQREYTKFKNRFLEMYSTIVNNGITDPAIGVDTILANINAIKNISSPWYYSDMVPYDSNRILINYTVLDVDVVEYEIDAIFDNTKLSNKAILVYLDGKQLLSSVDFIFNQTRPSIIFANKLEYNSKIEIRVFNNTDGCYIPETPTKLGLYPKFIPARYSDDSYQKTIDVIRGHDGSITPAFGDFRDELLLEIEKRIYNNIKATYLVTNFDINDYVPGKFRNTNYTKKEFDQIISRSFLTWAGSNRVDFSTNKWFNISDSWSWVYSQQTDKIDGDFLPGYWRGIYNYFYDTDAPNLRPWEMIGFSEMPSWWIDEYGPAPYTGGNLVLWNDLEQGIVRGTGEIRKQYIRPGLTTIIPVTDSGELKSPDQFIVKAFNATTINSSFVLGDVAPVEAAWRRSSEFPFALQHAIALMSPGTYFGQLINVQLYNQNNSLGQFIFKHTNQRITPSDIAINGDTSSGIVTRAAGYLNWISDYLTSNSLDPAATLKGYLDNIDVRLGYRVAGYTDKSYLKVLAEQSSPTSTNDSIIIPDENYSVFLSKSSPVDRITYSGVIIEKSANGFVISGYNLSNPYFTVVPSDPNSNFRRIVVGDSTGIVYNDYQRVKITIPYGYEFTNKQQVVDFLISYGRNLELQGFLFEEYNQELGTLKNWELSVKEFLTWSQQGWQSGNIIILSPLSSTVSVKYDNAIVDEITNLPAGSKILDTNFNVVKHNLFSVVRNNNSFTLSMPESLSVGLADLSLVQYEHILIFDNETVFNDIIYKSELGNRQYRLKLIGNKTDGWTGQVNPPGFIYSDPVRKTWAAGTDYRKGDLVIFKNLIYTALSAVDASDAFNFSKWQKLEGSSIKTGLLPNFAYNAVKFANMYDVDNEVQDQNINKFSNGLIGFRNRNYFDDLGLSTTSQTKFYQGYIRDKGTKDAIDALSSATVNNMSGELSFDEEWAFRVGEYGALDSNRYVEIQLSDSEYISDPLTVALVPTGTSISDLNVVAETKESLFKKSLRYDLDIFTLRDSDTDYDNDIQTAGYVNLNDIDNTLFDISQVQSLNLITDELHDGYKLWVAKDITNQWGVYRIDTILTTLVSIINSLDSYATFTTTEEHNLNAGDIFVVRNFSNEADGIYQVTRVESSNSIFALVNESLATVLATTPSLASEGTMFKLASLRFSNLTDASDYIPTHGWKEDDKVWIDNDTTGWGVYSKVSPWTFSTDITVAGAIGSNYYGQCVAVSPSGTILAVTAPGSHENNVDVIIKNNLQQYLSTGIITNPHVSTTTVGNALALNQNTLVVSNTNSIAPNSVHVYALREENFTLVVLDDYTLSDSAMDSGYGDAIAVSEDDNWLFVSAPRADEVYCYQKNGLTEKFDLPPTSIAGPLNSRFGAALDTNADGSVLIIGAPYARDGAVVDTGSVFVYVRTGTIFSLVQVPITAPEASIYEYAGTSVCIANESNDLFIGAPGKITGTYKSGVVYHYVKNGAEYEFKQEIKKPFTSFNENFGTAIKVDKTTNTLLVSSSGADSVNETTVDSRPYTLDNGATQFIDWTRNVGAVYVYDFITDSVASEYTYNQDLSDMGVTVGAKFGTAIAAHNGTIFVGVPNADTVTVTDSGKVAVFQNQSSGTGWKKIRGEEPKIDIGMKYNFFLYDKKSEKVLANLDYIDPAKGKILGEAQEEITFKTTFDPATYNQGTDPSVSIISDYHWGASQIGQLWWNMDLIRYVDYEQDTLAYRTNNWGKLFPGSTVEICEWVESDHLPTDYVGTGTPKYANNSALVQDQIIDPVTGIINTKYYYWVVNKTDFDSVLSFRSISALTVANLIESPAEQAIPYAAALQSNALTLFSSKSFISADDTILHVDYSVLRNDNIIHNEYELVSENSTSAIIPHKIVNKLVDSLTGSDAFGNIVPDYSLPTAERYGILIRPRQTMFADRLMASQNFVGHVNRVLLTVPAVLEFDLSKLYLEDPIPTSYELQEVTLVVDNTEEQAYINPETLLVNDLVVVEHDANFYNEWTLYRVVSIVDNVVEYEVVKTQGYRTTDYWSKVDWFDSTFDSTVKPTYTVDTLKDIDTLTLKDKDIIWVRNDGTGRFVVYRTNANLATTLVGVQEGTIQLSDALWAHNTNQIGFGNDNFDTIKFDLNPTIEFRNIVNAIKDDIFINSLDGEFNKVFFILLSYILSEQRMIDWAFKTSYISVLHKLRKLEQFPNYIKDNQSFYESYINEVKPYRTKIREYVINYQGIDNGDIHSTDFDLPAYFDTDFNMWRSPSGEHARDADIIQNNPQYADWLENYSFLVGGVRVSNPGIGYSAPPLVTVEGGGGSGAVLESVIDSFTGSIIEVRVIKSGSGYTSTPTIKIWGDGIDDSGKQTAICYPIMKNTTIRTISTTIKFDRIKYEAEILIWAPSIAVVATDIVAHGGNVYNPIGDFVTGLYFDPVMYTQLDDSVLESAQERALAFYRPGPGQTPNDLNQLFVGTEYPGVKVDGVNYESTQNVELDTNFESFYADSALGTRPEDVTVDGGNYVDTYSSHAPEELLPGMMFDTLDIKVFTIPPFWNGIDPITNPLGYRMCKVMSYTINNPWQANTSYTAGKQVSLDGINFEVLINFTSGNTFTESETFDEVYFNTHYKTLQDEWEFRRICANSTTTLAEDLSITDTEIFVTDVSALPEPSPSLSRPGVVCINGEKITYYTVDIINNSLGQIRRGVWGTGAPLLHAKDSLVVDASIEQKIPGETAYQTWLTVTDDDPYSIIDGTGMYASNTVPVDFIKSCHSYLPHLPGETGTHVDPNAFRTRFDDDGTMGGSGTVHGYDIDPFDSFIAG